MIDKIKKTREYLDYLEDHYNNIQRAWKELQEKCKDMRFVWDDYFYCEINREVINHDESKMSAEEFTQYRQWFFPAITEDRDRDLFSSAWKHHKESNKHHYQNWGSKDLHYIDWEISIVHMVVDWMAMGYKFGDTAQEYYEKNKDEICLQENAISFIYEIFDRINK